MSITHPGSRSSKARRERVGSERETLIKCVCLSIASQYSLQRRVYIKRFPRRKFFWGPSKVMKSESGIPMFREFAFYEVLKIILTKNYSTRKNSIKKPFTNFNLPLLNFVKSRKFLELLNFINLF